MSNPNDNVCPWARSSDLMRRYHDEEWGVPMRDDDRLFGLLLLEGAQAGLSWSTILNKRENYRRAFDGFDPVRIAAYDAAKIRSLLADEGIVRNRLKITSAITNARAFLAMRNTEESFATFIWSFVDDNPIQNRWKVQAEVPAATPASTAMSKALKKRGFKFVGPTICYAFMQSAGLVNDHLVTCPRHGALRS
ncbi:MAG TPA: DNA-3-methyladenine glycosylase I [Planctomycetes bacterium]|nr:DNA-3-methyladenine glycosylase I [Planctomycetota bacterium]